MLKYALTAVIALGIGLVLGTWHSDSPTDQQTAEEQAIYRCPMHPTVVGDHKGSCPICGMDLVKDAAPATATPTGERKVAYWRAPMDPSFTADAPGKSPMGMDLVPVYEDELATEGTVKIDPVTVQNIGVKIETVEKRPFGHTVRTIGLVDYDETGITDVNTKVTGWVEELYVDYTGQAIHQGQKLLEIYSPELVAAQEEYLTALDYNNRLERSDAAPDVVRGSMQLLNSAAQRLRYWDITDKQIRTLEQSRQVKRTMTIYSPQNGIVTHKAVHAGAHIKSGQHLYRIAELNKVWILADVYEYELPWIKVGQKATVQLSYLPGRTFAGEVSYIYPFLESKSRTVKVRLVIDNADLALKPDMYANVTIEVPAIEDALLVPTQALIPSGQRYVAIVSLGDGKFQPRDVVPGIQADGYYQILEGLRAGERIVTSSQFLIDSESNLKAAVSKMGGSAKMKQDAEPMQEESEDHGGHEGHDHSTMKDDDPHSEMDQGDTGGHMGGNQDKDQAMPEKQEKHKDGQGHDHDHSAH